MLCVHWLDKWEDQSLKSVYNLDLNNWYFIINPKQFDTNQGTRTKSPRKLFIYIGC